MAGRGIRQCLHDITAYLIVLIVVATLASLQFGFHLVSVDSTTVDSCGHSSRDAIMTAL